MQREPTQTPKEVWKAKRSGPLKASRSRMRSSKQRWSVHRCIFFFSSRRRHTRCSRDWSSDVCSSDLFLWNHGVLRLAGLVTTHDDQDHAGGSAALRREFTIGDQLAGPERIWMGGVSVLDRKSTRLNSSHGYISYAVFCLKKKKNNRQHAVRYGPLTRPSWACS